jgi:hypothetical protein
MSISAHAGKNEQGAPVIPNGRMTLGRVASQLVRRYESDAPHTYFYLCLSWRGQGKDMEQNILLRAYQNSEKYRMSWKCNSYFMMFPWNTKCFENAIHASWSSLTLSELGGIKDSQSELHYVKLGTYTEKQTKLMNSLLSGKILRLTILLSWLYLLVQ